MSSFRMGDKVTLSEAERHKILVEWNQTQSHFSRHKIYQQLFEEQVAKTPGAIALIFQHQTLTYRVLNQKANQMAYFLREQGVKPKDLVGIALEPSLNLLIAIIAILKAGGTYVPLDPAYPAERLRFMVEDTKATLLLTQAHFKERFKEISAQSIYLDDTKIFESYPTNNPKLVNDAEDLAYVIYTSGSTGKPKGVMITHHNLHHFIYWFQHALKTSKKNIFDFSSSISFDFSISNTLFPLTIGAKIAICQESHKKDPLLFLQHLIENKITHTKLTPSYFRQLKFVLDEEIQLADLTYIIFGGELLYANDLTTWLQKFPHQQLFCEYGPTEATVATSWILINQENINHYNKIIPIGKPAWNSKLYILDKELQPVSIGEVGELFIGGEGVSKGYLNRSDLTEKKFISNPFSFDKEFLYKTGDLCRYLPDGNIECIGRIDQQVKIRGFRIELGEIESTLSSHPDIKEVAVVTWQDQNNFLEKKLVAYFVACNDNQLDLNQLRQFLYHSLPTCMIPNILIQLDYLPLSPNGKINKSKLPLPKQLDQRKIILPRNHIEEELVAIWKNILGVKTVSIEDNFFELGGHSLAAVQMIAQIRNCLRKELRLEDIYRAGSVCGLAILLKNIQKINNSLPIPGKKISTLKTLPLSEMQFLFWLLKKFYKKANILNVVARIRLKGNLDKARLAQAFEMLLQTQPILRHHISGLVPRQSLETYFQFIIEEINLSDLKEREQETTLFSSLRYLEKYTWRKRKPLLVARLFLLKKDRCEIHITISHFVSDEMTPVIIFKNLSDFYNNNHLTYPIEANQFIDYIFQEKDNFKNNHKKDIAFWEEHLKKTKLFSFPDEKIVKKIKRDEKYTTYLFLPEIGIRLLKEFCITNRCSLSEALCAIVGLTLSEFCHSRDNVVIHLIKSTREKQAYQKAIGLFLRTDLIKVDLAEKPTLKILSKRIQNAIIASAPYQDSPTILKLACLLKPYWQSKKIYLILFKNICRLMTKLFAFLKLDPDILFMFCCVFLAKSKNHFFVDLNIMNKFISDISHHHESPLFRMQREPVARYKGEKMVVNNVLEIWFDREDDAGATLIVSGNLTSDFRKKIGEDIINRIYQISSVKK